MNRMGMTVSASWLALLGASFLFAPHEAVRALGLPPGPGVLTQVLGSALLAFASANWHARDSLLGGIYGRAVVVANQMHFVVGALVLLRHGAAAGGSAIYWVVSAAYTAEALWFSWLLWGPGPKTAKADG